MVLGRATGGIGVHVDSLTTELRARGHTVDLLTDALTAATFSWDDAHLHWPHGRDPRRLVAARRATRALAHGADVVHAHGHQAGAWAAAAGASPLVVSLHNAILPGTFPRPVATGLQRFVARRADLVTGASSDLVAEARRHGARWTELAEVPSPRVPALLRTPLRAVAERRLASAAFVASLERPGLDPALPLVLAVARVAPQKRIDVLLEVARRLRGEATVVLVGSADADLLGRIIAQDTAGDLIHLGPRPDLDELYATASVLVLTSTWEARALVVQEAMAAGLPVVATDTGGIPDLVRTGEEVVGELVPVGDAAATVAAIRRVLRDPARAEYLARRGREIAGSWADLAATAVVWENWYRRL